MTKKKKYIIYCMLSFIKMKYGMIWIATLNIVEQEPQGKYFMEILTCAFSLYKI